MSKKDFVRGIETAAKANEAFMRKQAEATEELGKRIIQKIDEHGKIIDIVLDTLNAQEKKELYNLESEYDIAELGQNEKEVLASFLLTLIAKYGQDTEEQKDYYFAIKKHLNVTDVSDELNLALVENVDSRAEAKAMFQTVCEFLFLKTGNLSFLETFANELDYFGLTAKVVNETVLPIEKKYAILGLRGIVEHYIPTEPEENLFPDHYGLISPIDREYVFDDSNRDIPVGSEKVFENLRVVVPKQLHIDGKAIFKNCELVLDYAGAAAIVSRESTSEVFFQNCEFKTLQKTKLCMIGIDGKCTFESCLFNGLVYRYGLHDDVIKDSDGDEIEYNSSFIDVDGYSDGTATLELNHCRIEGCEGTFINADGNQLGDNFNVTIRNCSIENHTGNFLLARFADKGNNTGVKIQDSTFSNISAYAQAEDWDFKFKNFLSLIHVSSATFQCDNSHFEIARENVLDANSSCFGTETSQITRCSFIDFNQYKPLTGNISECSFSKAKVIRFGNCGESLNSEVVISKSSFNEINGIVTIEYGKIEHCEFVDSSVTVSIVGKSIGKDSYYSTANDLKFTNCVASPHKSISSITNPPCFLQADSYLSKPGLCVLFNGCKFENCRTAGNYINTDKKIFGTFDRVKVISPGRETGTTLK